jgi:catalase
VYIPGGKLSIETLKEEPDTIYFINEANKHCKAISVGGKSNELLYLTAAGIKIHNENKKIKTTWRTAYCLLAVQKNL